MKKLIYIIATIILILSSHLTIAQSAPTDSLNGGEWKWAHLYHGDEMGRLYQDVNKIFSSNFDAEGNLYIFGSFGGDGRFDNDFENHPIVDIDYVNLAMRGGTLLIKYDTLGNIVWKKIVKSSVEATYPQWMELKDSLIHISGYYYTNAYDFRWLYFLDTLITKQAIEAIPEEERFPPFQFGTYNYVATLDLDGNVIDYTMMNYRCSTWSSNRGNGSMFRNFYGTPMHVDQDNNIYLFTNRPGVADSNYWVKLYSYKNQITHCDSIYIPTKRHDQGIFKIASNGELLWWRPLVDSTSGFHIDSTRTTNPIEIEFYGLDADEEDNMYVTGLIRPYDGYSRNEYPCHIYFDSIHYLTMNSRNETTGIPFCLKVDTDGNIKWVAPQLRRSISDQRLNSRMDYNGVDVYEDYVYVPVLLQPAFVDTIYINDEIFPFGTYQMWLKLDKENGSLINYGYDTTCLSTSRFQTNFVNENHIYMITIVTKVYSSNLTYILHWDTDGYLIDKTYCGVTDRTILSSVAVNDRGDIFANICTQGEYPIAGFDYQCWIGSSNAAYGVFHNDAYAHPHVREEQSILWDQNLNYYIGDSLILLTATATSGLPVTYTCSDTSIARISADTLFLLNEGMATITASQSGNAQYQPATTIEKTLTISNSVGINTPTKNKISIYPNPTSGVVHLSANGIEQVEVLSLTGERLATFHHTNQIDISNFAIGTYILKVITNEEVYIQKVIKK